jgi:glycerol transport system ATP-binding protein
LLQPTEGQILFNGEDVTNKNPVERNIAQIFQFPVIYDTMSVFDNLAFPLKNRGISQQEIDQKVNEIAEMLELTSTLHNRASGLTADGKQKISLGRGLVRSDVNVIMFDEPLTVIDPHLKWILRSKLKELHQKINRTMIYVTHDQTEALTFADQVVVMHEAEIVQVGTPVELFEKPKHTFVGHFIGSPGMNILPCKIDNGNISINGNKIETKANIKGNSFSKTEVGIRPEFVEFNKEGLPVKILKVSNTGRHKIVDTESESGKIKVIAKPSDEIPSGSAFLNFNKDYTYVYGDNWIIE